MHGTPRPADMHLYAGFAKRERTLSPHSANKKRFLLIALLAGSASSSPLSHRCPPPAEMMPASAWASSGDSCSCRMRVLQVELRGAASLGGLHLPQVGAVKTPC